MIGVNLLSMRADTCSSIVLLVSDSYLYVSLNLFFYNILPTHIFTSFKNLFLLMESVAFSNKGIDSVNFQYQV